VKETGIIMSGNHPKLILEGKKTMTRRTQGLERVNKEPDNWLLAAVFQDGKARFSKLDGSQELTLKCPYGGYGDRLWVREIWRIFEWDNESGQFYIEYRSGGKSPALCVTDEVLEKYWLPNANWPEDKWRPSLFMPRWASRILLEITEVRAERLQEITYADARAEGVLPYLLYRSLETPQAKKEEATLLAFQDLWDSLNGKRGFPWDGNWWVWPINFKKLEE